MTRTSLAVLGVSAVAILGVHTWLATALYARTDNFIYLWTWLEALLYVPAAIVVLRDDGAQTVASRRILIFILAVAAALRLMLLFGPPTSTDLYRYIWDGRVQGAGINPYDYVPADPHLAPLRDADIYPWINRKDYAHTIYPPLAQIAFFLIAKVSPTVVGLKGGMLVFEAAAIWAMMRLIARRGLPRTRILLYAWHPLPVWEIAGSGHVDAMVLACLCLGLLAAECERPGAAGLALGGLFLTKYFPVVVGPALYRRWGWRLPAAFAAAIVVCYLPYIGAGRKVLGFLGGYSDEEGLADGSGIYLWLLLQHLLPVVTDAWFRVYPLALAAILAILGLVVLLRHENRAVSIGGALALALVATVGLSPHYAWYFCWLVPFLPFVPSPALLWLTSAAAFLEPVEWPDDFDLVSYIYMPFLVLIMLEIAWRMRRARRRPHAEPVGIAAR